jgi:cytidylate kinase
LSKELARRLKFDFFDKEILHQVAESSRLSETILKSVEEKALPAVEEWIHSLFLERYLSGDYFRHLSKVLMAIAEHGRAVILGRGAGFLLKPGTCLRILLVAPLKDRILAVAGREGMPHDEAKRRVIQDESNRRAFIRRHFHADMLDPVHYDLVINTAGLHQEAAIAAIQAAWEGKWKAPPAAANLGAA